MGVVHGSGNVMCLDVPRAMDASLLLGHGMPAVADAFSASRLAGGASTFGTLPTGVDVDSILARQEH
jgi:putative acyl-CoA dehydrogenase